MAADVSSLVRILNGYIEDQQQPQQIIGAEHKIPVTRDLLGGCSKLGSKELDLDLQVPNGFEKRLDLKSGKVYLHRCNSPVSSSSDPKQRHQKPVPALQDLNFPPSLAEENLDLKLFPSNEYQSVCTLDKVKSALERAEKESGKKRHANCGSSDMSSSRICSSLSSPSSPSIREGEAGDGEEEKSSDSFESGPVFAAGCPSCLLYVLLSKSNPKCPRCATVVPFRSFKKPRIDLNATV